MWKLLLAFLLLVSTTHGYDHEVYRTCAQKPLCGDNRELERKERYLIGLEGASFSKGLASFRVRDAETADLELFLNISAIKGNIFRVQFEEVGSTRFHIEYMLDGEPDTVNFDDVDLSLNSATLIVGRSKAVVNLSPLSIEFYEGEDLQFVLEGDRITLQANENNWTPLTFGVVFPSASRMYGLHEHADHLALRTTEPDGYDPYRVRTLDLTYYELYDTQAMYGAVPVLYGHGRDGTAGIFVNNAAEMWVEITNKDADVDQASALFMVDSGAFDVFVLLGPTPAAAASQYVSLTGVPHLPPIWSLGYHQCRWGYWNQSDLQTTLATLVENDFPIDVIWLDIQHTDNDKFFTWNPENFSTPFEMMANLSAQNRYVITLTDPHFKKEEGYFIYDKGIEKDYFIKYPNGTVYEAECWPGTAVWMDYLNPEVRQYYADRYSYKNWNGTTPALGGIWNDMNEAALFDNDTEKTFPYDLVHYGGVQNRDIHNIYGLLQILSTHAGLIQRDDGKLRPFILTRAHTAGTQRYAAIWTGDNTAEWGFIPLSISMCLSSALSGISFCGADMGGFWGDPTDELLMRFFQSGTWLPFFREHSGTDSKRREPYLFSKDVQDVLRNTMQVRYQHLPVWYTLFYELNRFGNPVIRPLWYHYPDDEDTFDIDDQLLLGENILVKVIAEPNATSTQVYFPGGERVTWYSAFDDTTYPGVGLTEVPVTINHIPVFYRQGSIIPLKVTPRLSTAEMKDDLYTLYAFPRADLAASGRVYIDDTSSFDYQHIAEYNYLDLKLDALEVVTTSVDDSNSDGFELGIDTIVVFIPGEMGKDGLRRSIKTEYKQTHDGTPLSQLKLSGKTPTRLKLA